MAKIKRKITLAERLARGEISEDTRPKLSKYKAKQPEVAEKLAVAQGMEAVGAYHFAKLAELKLPDVRQPIVPIDQAEDELYYQGGRMEDYYDRTERLPTDSMAVYVEGKVIVPIDPSPYQYDRMEDGWYDRTERLPT